MQYTLLGFSLTLAILLTIDTVNNQKERAKWMYFLIGTAVTKTIVAAFSEGAMLAVSVYLACKGVKRK